MTMTTDGYNSAYQSITIKYCLSGTKLRMLNPAGFSRWDLKPSTVGVFTGYLSSIGFLSGVTGFYILGLEEVVTLLGGTYYYCNNKLYYHCNITITRLDMYFRKYGLGKCK